MFQNDQETAANYQSVDQEMAANYQTVEKSSSKYLFEEKHLHNTDNDNFKKCLI